MENQKFKTIGTSTSTPVENQRRKVVTVGRPKQYSLQVDLSDFIGMDPEKGNAVECVPFEFRTASGDVLLKGVTDQSGDTGRVFTREEKEVFLYVGDGDWELSLDCKHTYPDDNQELGS